MFVPEPTLPVSAFTRHDKASFGCCLPYAASKSACFNAELDDEGERVHNRHSNG
jgi:hypothetical protein